MAHTQRRQRLRKHTTERRYTPRGREDMERDKRVNIREVSYLDVSSSGFEQLLEAIASANSENAVGEPEFDAKVIDLDARRVTGVARGRFAHPSDREQQS